MKRRRQKYVYNATLEFREVPVSLNSVRLNYFRDFTCYSAYRQIRLVGRVLQAEKLEESRCRGTRQLEEDADMSVRTTTFLELSIVLN